MTAFASRILLLVPHPDDEVVAAACAIGRARQQGSEIFALYLTHGCIAREVRWPWDRKAHEAHVDTRRAEGEEAARFLGLTPVGWRGRPARSLWRDLNCVYEEVMDAVRVHKIEQIWTPAYEGGNADHDGLNACGAALAKATGLSVLEFAEYNFFQGRAHSHAFPFPNGTEVVLKLSPEEVALKRKALEIYRSEKCNLGYVKTEQECFRPLASYDYEKPPHGGKLWYARFQWVPFRHPRVDFTNPAEVCVALTSFLKRR